jgi:hypothetical protein
MVRIKAYYKFGQPPIAFGIEGLCLTFRLLQQSEACRREVVSEVSGLLLEKR